MCAYYFAVKFIVNQVATKLAGYGGWDTGSYNYTCHAASRGSHFHRSNVYA